MKNSFIQFHPLLLLFMIASYFLGRFTELLCFFIIITIHELGHLIAAKKLNWNISRLVIWPFGGVMETEDFYNKPNKEEWIVILSGPLQHLWIYAVLLSLEFFNVESIIIDQLFFANTVILLFNLLPILPLDGGRFIFLIVSKYFSFHQTIAIMSLLSIIFIASANVIIYMLGIYSIHFTFLSIFLILDNWLTWKNKHIFLLKHLLARYFVPYTSRSNIVVLKASPLTPISELVKKFKKECYHYIYLNNGEKAFTEDDCLKALFTENHSTLRTISQLKS